MGYPTLNLGDRGRQADRFLGDFNIEQIFFLLCRVYGMVYVVLCRNFNNNFLKAESNVSTDAWGFRPFFWVIPWVRKRSLKKSCGPHQELASHFF